MATSKAHRNEKIEEWLNEQGVKWEFAQSADVNVDFDMSTSLRNQARLEIPLHDDLIEQYTESMLNREKFPPVVAYRKGGKLVLIDGNHRITCAQNAGIKNFPTYVVVGATPDQIVELTYKANTTHGRGNSREERMAHALQLVKRGYTQVRAASEMKVSRADLQRARDKESADKLAEVLGVRKTVWNGFATSSRIRFKALRNDVVFVAAVDAAYRMGLNTTDVSSFVSEISTRKTAAKQLDYIADYENDHRSRSEKVIVTKKRGKQRPPEELAMTFSKSLLKMLENDDFGKAWLPQEYEELIVSLQTLNRQITKSVRKLRADMA